MQPELMDSVHQVTPRKRNPAVDPITPDPNERVSKRAFDADLKQWRKKLHSIVVVNGSPDCRHLPATFRYH